MEQERNIIFYDSDCFLCSGFVCFVVKREKKAHFMFTDFRSKKAKALLKNLSFDGQGKGGFLLFVEGQKLYHSSEALIRIFSKLCFPWFLLKGARFFPVFLRDFIYRQIAKRRYRLSKGMSNCKLLSTKVLSKERLL